MSHAKMPKQPRDEIKSIRWGIAALKSVSAGLGVVGGGYKAFDLLNRETNRAHRMIVKDLGAGVGLPVSVSLLSDDYTYFFAAYPVNFPDFDGATVEIGSTDLALYSWSKIEIYSKNLMQRKRIATVKTSGFGLSTPEIGISRGPAEIYYSDGKPLQAPDYEIGEINPEYVSELVTGFKVTKNADSIVIILSSGVLFDFNKDWLHYQATDTLSKVFKYINSTSGFRRIVIEGHTDSIGTSGYNKDLSMRRAQAVLNYFKKHADFLDSKYQLKASGFGETKPVEPNTRNGADNPAGREKNRRVEIYLYKN